VLDGKKWRSVMGHDYFSAIKLIACVKDVVASISCDAAITDLRTVTSVNSICKSTLAGPSLLCMFCGMQYFVAIRFVAFANGLYIQ
jgi:hypothetical protein